MTTSIQAEQKVLRLVLKKKWFDMIASGEKKDEYRDLTEYWNSRLNFGNLKYVEIKQSFLPKRFDVIEFIHGYQPDSPRIRLQWFRY